MRPQGSEQMTACPTCPSGPMREGTKVLRRTVGGREFTREVPALLCDACGERLTSSADLAAFERQIADEVLATRLYAPDAVGWVLDGYELEPDAIGATWREVKAWARGEGEPGPEVWPALAAAVEARRAAGLPATGTGE